MPNPTPGEIAYDAYWHHTQQMLRGHPWETLPPTEQAHWEAAAQAVAEKAITDLLEVQRILADAKEQPHA